MTNAPTILVVEDEEDSVLLLESAFRRAQFSNPVHRVSHGALAMEYLSQAVAKNQPVPLPALVLLDLKLPLVSGIEVLKWIREREEFDCLPVIVFSSSREDTDMKRAYSLGANSFLVKSSDNTQLGNIAKSLVEYWLKFNEMPRDCVETTR